MASAHTEKAWGMRLGLIAFSLFSAMLWGLFWYLTSPTQSVTLMLAYAAGLSMIFLPCTLPLVFVIIPLSQGKGRQKGFLMALMFGLGMTLTLTLYGASVALVGKWLGMDQLTRYMFQIAGVAAYIFGLSQMNILHVKFPSFGGVPGWAVNRSDYIKSFLMGFFLGNAGVGCPNPAFYILLAFIAGTGDVLYGSGLGAVHGLGRATPLLFISILAILGFNATTWVKEKREGVERLTGWGLLVVGVVIFSLGFFGMDWWEKAFIHQGWNRFFEAYFPTVAESNEAAEAFGIKVKPSPIEHYIPFFPWIFMLVMLIFPYYWSKCQRLIDLKQKIQHA